MLCPDFLCWVSKVSGVSVTVDRRRIYGQLEYLDATVTFIVGNCYSVARKQICESLWNTKCAQEVPTSPAISVKIHFSRRVNSGNREQSLLGTR